MQILQYFNEDFIIYKCIDEQMDGDFDLYSLYNNKEKELGRICCTYDICEGISKQWILQ